MSEHPIICASCNTPVIDHDELRFASCLSYLSGEIRVYRKNIEDEK